jgi:hypothetical protein
MTIFDLPHHFLRIRRPTSKYFRPSPLALRVFLLKSFTACLPVERWVALDMQGYCFCLGGEGFEGQNQDGGGISHEGNYQGQKEQSRA